MKDGIIIQARTGSTRLHNKILLPFYGEQRIIDILIANIKQACPDKCIVLATTNRPQDDVLAEVAHQSGILSFRGDEDQYHRGEKRDLRQREETVCDEGAEHHNIRYYLL